MTLHTLFYEGKNAVGQPRCISVSNAVGCAHKWKIQNPETGDVVFSSQSIGAPSYGYYRTAQHAMRSAKRILKTLAQ